MAAMPPASSGAQQFTHPPTPQPEFAPVQAQIVAAEAQTPAAPHAPPAPAAAAPNRPTLPPPQAQPTQPGPAAYRPAPVRLEGKEREEAARLARKALNFGVLGGIGKLQAEWDGEDPQTFPYDSEVPGANGKAYESLETHFSQGAKGRNAVMGIAPGAASLGAAALECVIRVIAALPGGLGGNANPLQALHSLLSAPDWQTHLSAVDSITVDREMVLQMLALYAAKYTAIQTLGVAPYRYGVLDMDVLKLMQKVPATGGRLERWGPQLAQMYIDFLRHIGEQAALHHWEKRISLTEAFARAEIRALPTLTRIPLSYDALTELRRRSEK